MLLVQKFLKSGKSFEDLYNEHKVNHKIINNKVCLNYSTLESDISNPLACECRGLVLDVNTFEVIAYPFNRFFNYNTDGIPNIIDFNHARYENKLDGTCLIVYWDYNQNKWCSGTRSLCEANLPIDNYDLSFSKLADLACNEMLINKEYKGSLHTLMNCLNDSNILEAKERTFIFELTSPMNRIVCDYKDTKLTLLGVRNNLTFKEELPKNWILDEVKRMYNINTSKVFDFNNFTNAYEEIQQWDPKDREGVVLIDNNFNRAKIKSNKYTNYNKKRDAFCTSKLGSTRNCISAVFSGDDDDLVGMLPEYVSNRLLKIKEAIKILLNDTIQYYNSIKHITERKDFVFEAKKHKWFSALISMQYNSECFDFYEFIKKSYGFKNKEGMLAFKVSFLDLILSLILQIDPSIKDF
jgi:hypothetical protein